MRLADQVVIVTGATRGIGRAVAERCVAEGARVLATDHPDQLEAGETLVAASGDRVVLHLDDLIDSAAPARIIAAAAAAFGHIDGLVNNAAVVTRSDIATTDAATFDRIIAINARAPMLLVQAALSALERSGGRVVNIGSINAHCGERGLLAYSMSKGALMTMTRNLGDALAPRGVRINQLNLGWVLTEIEDDLRRAEGFAPGWHDQLPADQTPAGRMTRPAEVAPSVAFWLSAESFPASGSVIDLEQYPVIGRNPEKEPT